jgi:hypothetical protein
MKVLTLIFFSMIIPTFYILVGIKTYSIHPNVFPHERAGFLFRR